LPHGARLPAAPGDGKARGPHPPRAVPGGIIAGYRIPPNSPLRAYFAARLAPAWRNACLKGHIIRPIIPQARVLPSLPAAA